MTLVIASPFDKRAIVRDRIGRFAAVPGGGGPASQTGLEVREGALWRDSTVADHALTIQRDAPTKLERDNAVWIADAEVRASRELSGGDTFQRHTHEDGTFTADRAKLHDQILTEWSRENDDKPSGVDTPTVVFMGGLPGAGKSTATRELSLDDKVVVNADAFKTGHDEATGRRWSKMPEYTGGHAAGSVHEESAYLADRALGIARLKRQHVVFDATMGSLGNGVSYEEAASDGGIARKIKDFKDAGYRVEVRFVDVSVDTSVDRSLTRYLTAEKSRGNGRYVPASYVRGLRDPEFGSRNRKTFERVKHVADAYLIVDNNGKTPKVIGSRGTLTKRKTAAESPIDGKPGKTLRDVYDRAEAPYNAAQIAQIDDLNRQLVTRLREKKGTS